MATDREGDVMDAKHILAAGAAICLASLPLATCQRNFDYGQQQILAAKITNCTEAGGVWDPSWGGHCDLPTPPESDE